MGKEPVSELKATIVRIENYLRQKEKDYRLEHLSGPQGFTVMYLYKHQNREIFIKDIERKLEISKSVASNLIRRMEKNGFVAVIPSQEDKRYKQLVLTDLGHGKAAILDQFFTDVKHSLLEGVSKEEVDTVFKVMQKIRQNLDKKE